MSTHKSINIICCVALVFAILLTFVFVNAEAFGILPASRVKGYENRLFDSSTVHTISIIMDDWEGFLAQCTDEEYVPCAVVIDNESYKNVAIRAKGNTSLTSVQNYGNDRYSFKIEFDHYDDSKNYHGLDKLSLNNIIQDNTYCKDFVCYQLMHSYGVAAPLCSFVQITVNGEDWGLYLAVEGVEDAFLERNFGKDYGELYKPDSASMGGGRGNGADFRMEDIDFENLPEDFHSDRKTAQPGQGNTKDASGHRQPSDAGGFKGGGGFGGMGGDDVKLIYTDDDYSSYSAIFDSAKTEITDADRDRLIASLKNLKEIRDIENTVDVEEVIRYFVVHNFVCNFDSYTGSIIHNYYLYEKNGQMSMIPWDYNLAFGGFVGGGDATSMVNYPIDTPVSGGNADDRPMLAWIFSDEKYTELYHQYFSEFIAEYFESGYFAEWIDEVEKMIAPYVEKDPTKFCTYAEFETGMDTLKAFCLLRAESVRGQLDGSIPSTSAEQSGSNALIDASSFRISDMGGMEGGRPQGSSDRGGAQMQPPGEGGMPDFSGEKPQGGSDRDGAQMQPPGEGDMPDFSGEKPQGGSDRDGAQMQPPGEGEMPDFSGEKPQGGSDRDGKKPFGPEGSGFPQEEAKNDASAWILLGVSVGVLLLGLGVVFAYKKRV